MSAYAPIKLNGKVIGATGVDVDYTWVARELQQIMTATILDAAGCFAISLAFLLIFYSERDEFYYMPFCDLDRAWKRAQDNGRKSIPFEEIVAFMDAHPEIKSISI